MRGWLCVNARLVVCECAVSGTRIQDAPRAFWKKARAFKTRIQEKIARIQEKIARILDKKRAFSAHSARIQRAFSAHSGQTVRAFRAHSGRIQEIQYAHSGQTVFAFRAIFFTPPRKLLDSARGVNWRPQANQKKKNLGGAGVP